jgi:hypothetical protein
MIEKPETRRGGRKLFPNSCSGRREQEKKSSGKKTVM